MKTALKISAALIALVLCGCSGPDAATLTEQSAEDIPETTEPVTERAEETETETFDLSDKGNRYYFSADGDDNAAGTSPDFARKSLSLTDGMTFRPGDRILLRRGDEWHERLTLRGKGEEDAWIYVGFYGDPSLPAPRISLRNGRDDIAILCEDSENGFGYLIFDGISVGNTHTGIYLRSDGSFDDGHIMITGCDFFNVNCPDLMEEALTDISWLGKNRAGLSGGGAYEYIWPAAVNAGGRPALPLASVKIDGVCEPKTVLSCVTVENCRFDGCVVAVGANCYNYHYGTGEHQFRQYTKNWVVRNVTCVNTMIALNFDSCDFGWDGTDGSEWGIFENIVCTGGMEGFTMSAGTTAALLSSCCDLYVKNSRFGGCRNGGRPDGCGFDFERDDHNITLDNCVFDDNDGQGVLIMDTVMTDQVAGKETRTPSTDCTIRNCVFYGNMKNVFNGNYRFDILVFNHENENISVTGCEFHYTAKTAGNAKVAVNKRGSKKSPAGQVIRGLKLENNEMYEYADRSALPPLEEILARR